MSSTQLSKVCALDAGRRSTKPVLLSQKLDSLFPSSAGAVQSIQTVEPAVHERPRPMRTMWGQPSDQFARFGKPARVLHQTEADKELNAKGCVICDGNLSFPGSTSRSL